MQLKTYTIQNIYLESTHHIIHHFHVEGHELGDKGLEMKDLFASLVHTVLVHRGPVDNLNKYNLELYRVYCIYKSFKTMTFFNHLGPPYFVTKFSILEIRKTIHFGRIPLCLRPG